jgi:Tol biopolymer transport system component
MHRRHLVALLIVSLVILTASTVATAQTPPRDLDALRELYDHAAPPDAVAAMTAADPAAPIAPAAPNDPAAADDVFAWSEIAFESARNGRWAIYRMKPNFTEIVPAVVTEGHVSSPSLRPNGAERILFTAETGANIDIYSARADGSDVQRLTDYIHDDIMPVWSPDGRQIAFQSERTGDNDIYVMDADGSNERRLTTSDYFDGQPTWSPDGNHIAFSSSRSGRYQIWVMDANGGNQRQLTHILGALYPSWSPFANVIAFSGIFGHATEDFFLDLFLMNADGTGIRNTASMGATDIHSATWSPTGSHAAYVGTRYEEHGDELYVNSSHLYMSHWDSFYLRYDSRYEDDPLIWSASWASRDGQAPDPCAVDTPAIRAWRSAFVAWQATDNMSGVARYDVEWRPAGTTAWTPLTLPNPASGFTLDERAPGESVEWRCRATDASGNRADWATAAVRRTLVDGAPPSSAVRSATAIDADTVQVTWQGRDYGSGVAAFDVWVRPGTEGDWSRWQTATTALSAPFTGQTGQTYFFRSQAIDRAGIREPWRPAPQAEATLGAPDAPSAPEAPVTSVRALLPLVTAVLGSANAQDALSIADWPTLGGNAGHSGVNAGDPGGSRYARVWSTEVGRNGQSIPQQVTTADGIVMLTVEEGYQANPRVIAVNLETGIPAWSYEANYDLSHPPAIAHGAAYFGKNSYDGQCLIFAADLHTGRQIWQGGSYCDYHTSFQHPLVVGDRLYVANRNSVQELMAATGKPGWNSDQSRTNMSGGWAPAYFGGQIFSRPYEHTIQVLDATTGQTLWSRENLHEDYSLHIATAPVVTRDAVITVGYSLSTLARNQLWHLWTIEAEVEDYFAPDTMPAIAGHVVYALRGPKLVAYNLVTGAELWRFTADGPLLSAPVVAGKYIYVASATHTYVLNRMTHELEWDMDTGGILSVANGYLFIAEQPDPATGMAPATLHAYRAQEP